MSLIIVASHILHVCMFSFNLGFCVVIVFKDDPSCSFYGSTARTGFTERSLFKHTFSFSIRFVHIFPLSILLYSFISRIYFMIELFRTICRFRKIFTNKCTPLTVVVFFFFNVYIFI